MHSLGADCAVVARIARPDSDRCPFITETYGEYKLEKLKTKCREFVCPCGLPACPPRILKWGDINRAHLAHRSGANTSGGCGMTFEHAEAQLALKHALATNGTVTISVKCGDCAGAFPRHVGLGPGDRAVTEYKYQSGSRRSADVAVVAANGETRIVIEVLHSSRTDESSRPDDMEWYEVYAAEVNEQREQPAISLTCVRRVERRCSKCKERRRRKGIQDRLMLMGAGRYPGTCGVCWAKIRHGYVLCALHWNEMVAPGSAAMTTVGHRILESNAKKAEAERVNREYVNRIREQERAEEDRRAYEQAMVAAVQAEEQKRAWQEQETHRKEREAERVAVEMRARHELEEARKEEIAAQKEKEALEAARWQVDAEERRQAWEDAVAAENRCQAAQESRSVGSKDKDRPLPKSKLEKQMKKSGVTSMRSTNNRIRVRGVHTFFKRAVVEKPETLDEQ